MHGPSMGHLRRVGSHDVALSDWLPDNNAQPERKGVVRGLATSLLAAEWDTLLRGGSVRNVSYISQSNYRGKQFQGESPTLVDGEGGRG